MITIFYIIETILIYFYSLGFSLNARPHKRQRFNHHRVEIKVVVLLYCKRSPGWHATCTKYHVVSMHPGTCVFLRKKGERQYALDQLVHPDDELNPLSVKWKFFFCIGAFLLSTNETASLKQTAGMKEVHLSDWAYFHHFKSGNYIFTCEWNSSGEMILTGKKRSLHKFRARRMHFVKLHTSKNFDTCNPISLYSNTYLSEYKQ